VEVFLGDKATLGVVPTLDRIIQAACRIRKRVLVKDLVEILRIEASKATERDERKLDREQCILNKMVKDKSGGGHPNLNQ
jgi:hypothetical protein